MSQIDFILKRHSCREFSKDEILREEDLEILIEAMRWAPSAGNCQPWFFYVVFNKDIKKLLAHAAYQDFVSDAACVFVICVEPEVSAKYYGKRGRELYCIQDTAAAIENLLLAATSLGYGSCWVGAFDEERVIKILDIPQKQRPIALIPIGPGKPADDFPKRRQIKDIVKIVR